MQMLTAHRIKILQSLNKKKFRQKYNLFLVEGNKTIRELKNSKFKVDAIYSVDPEACDLHDPSIITKISEAELKKISQLQNPKDSVAVCYISESILTDVADKVIILDGIQDPGNFGTIIRLADWFGIDQLICSEDTVDVYNPKVIQASMGSFTRVDIHYTSLIDYLNSVDLPILGADMEGENIYQYNFPERWALVLGNEGNGLRPETERMLTDKISIPRFGKKQTTESLNVSMAAGIILGELFSRQ